MIDLNTELETAMATTSLVIMLCMAVWLFFRRESDGEKSLYLKMIEPYDDEIGQPSSIPRLLPSVKRSFANDLLPTHSHGNGAVNQRIGLIPLGQSKEETMESLHAPSTELHEGQNIKQTVPFRLSYGQLAQKSAGMCSEQRSLGAILVVGDDPEIHKFVRNTCENSGYEVIEAKNGAQAIKVLTGGEESSKGIDTIITDISMPKITGLEAIAYFQKEFPSIPLIVLTGIADLELAISFIGGGISNYLVKPFEEEQLNASVAGAIRHRQLTYA